MGMLQASSWVDRVGDLFFTLTTSIGHKEIHVEYWNLKKKKEMNVLEGWIVWILHIAIAPTHILFNAQLQDPIQHHLKTPAKILKTQILNDVIKVKPNKVMFFLIRKLSFTM